VAFIEEMTPDWIEDNPVARLVGGEKGGFWHQQFDRALGIDTIPKKFRR